MPYLIRHSKKGGYEVVKRDTGEVAAHSTSLSGARGYIYHATKNESKAVHGERKKK